MNVGVSLAVDLLVELLKNASQVSQLIQTVQAQGRTTLTADEWATLIGGADSAEARLTAAIAAAKAAGN